jgi:hypothetical protein
VASILTLVVPHPVQALPVLTNLGGRVLTYGQSGSVQSTIPGAPGRIEVADTISDGSGGLWLAVDAVAGAANVVHLDAFGQPVAIFGADGVVSPAGFTHIDALAVAPLGGVTVVGFARDGNESYSFAKVARLTAAGEPDPSFGSGDPVTLPLVVNYSASNLAVLALIDGRTVVAVESVSAVVKTDGTLDASLGDDGVISTGMSGRPRLAARAAGYVIASLEQNPAGANEPPILVLLAYSSPGVVDRSFGVEGRAASRGDVPDRTIWVTNLVVTPTAIFAGTQGHVYRLSLTGEFDASYSGTYAGDYPAWRSMGVQSDGAVVVANEFVATRLTPLGGVVDHSWGNTGTLPLGVSAAVSYTQARMVVTGTRIYFAGTTSSPGVSDDGFAVLARDGAIPGGVPVLIAQDTTVQEGHDARIVLRLDRPFDVPGGTVDCRVHAIGRDRTPQGVIWVTPCNVDPDDKSQLVALVSVADDNAPEPDEQFELTVMSAYDAIIAKGAAVITVTSDDAIVPPNGVDYIATVPPGEDIDPGETIAAGDVDGDFIDELVTARGPGGVPDVDVRWLRVSPGGPSLGDDQRITPFDPRFRGGVNVATADVDGDGIDEIITAAGVGGGPHVRVYRYTWRAVVEVAEFMAYGSAFSGGVTVAGADVDGDGRDEIVTGAGPGGGPHVRVFSVDESQVSADVSFMAYGAAFSGGVTVAGGDIDGDGRDEVITGAGPGGGPHVEAFSIGALGPRVVASFMAYEPAFGGGVSVAAGDVDYDRADEIVTGAGPGGGPHVVVNDVNAGLRAATFGWMAFPSFFGALGVSVAVGHFGTDGSNHVIVAADSHAGQWGAAVDLLRYDV